MPRGRGGIELNGKSYKLFEGKSGPDSPSTWDAPIADYPARIKDEIRIMQDWSDGAFWSRRNPGNGYALDAPGYSRCPNLFTPPGRYAAVSMPDDTRTFPTPVAESRQPIAGADFTDTDGLTRFYFTVGSYICRITGDGNPETVAWAGHGYQIVSMVRWQKADGTPVLLCGGYWSSTTNPALRGMLQWDGSSWSRLTFDRALLWPVHWKPSGSLAGAVDGSSLAASVGSMTLVGNSTANAHKVAWVAAGVNYDDATQWTSEVPIGTSAYGISRIAGSPGHLYFVKYDGIYDLNQVGDSPNLTPWWSDAVDTGNGIAVNLHDSALIATHVSGLTYLDLAQDTPQQRIPVFATSGDGTGNETPDTGRTAALCTYGGWEYEAKVNSAGTTYINVGAKRSTLGQTGEGRGPLLWHGAEAVIPDVAITMLCVSHASGYPQLMMGGVSVADGLTPTFYRQSLPKASTPLQDLRFGTGLLAGGFRFHDFARKYLSVEDWRYPTSQKVLWSFDVQADGLDSGVWAKVWAAANLGDPYALTENASGGFDPTGYTEQGIVTRAPGGFIDPGDENITGTHTSIVIDLKGRATMPAIFRALQAQARINVALAEELTYVLEVTSPATSEGLSRVMKSTRQTYYEIAALQEAGPVSLINEFGEDLVVDILPASVQENVKPHPLDRDTYVGVVIFRGRVRTRPFEWGNDWNSGRTWGRSAT